MLKSIEGNFNNPEVNKLLTKHFIELRAASPEGSAHVLDIPGLKVVSNDNYTIAIDINISENLKMEGIARDFVNKVQNVWKEMKFEVTDKVELNIFCDNKFLIESIKNNLNYVSNEIQAKKIGFIKKENDLKELQINDSIIYFNISKSS